MISRNSTSGNRRIISSYHTLPEAKLESPKERKKSPRFNGFFIRFSSNRWGSKLMRGIGRSLHFNHKSVDVKKACYGVKTIT